MRITDGDLAHLFHYGMVIERLDGEGDASLRGQALPHPDNPDVFYFVIRGVGDSWYSREVQPDGSGRYTFTDAWGQRRRIYPLPESEKLWWIDAKAAPREAESTPVPAATSSRDLMAEEPEVASAPEMNYYLGHYDSEWKLLGVWASQSDGAYRQGAPGVAVDRARKMIEARPADSYWPEWIDALAYAAPDSPDRWDLVKSDELLTAAQLLAEFEAGDA